MMISAFRAFPILLLLTACEPSTPQAPTTSSPSEPPKLLPERTLFPVSEPWGVDDTAMPDGKRYIAAISHDENQLIIWALIGRQAKEVARAPTGFHPDDVKWVDWDQDGSRDELLVTVEGESRVALWRFEAEKLSEIASVKVAVPPQTVEVADLDNDGRLDLILGPYKGTHVNVLFHQGDFQFAPVDLLGAPDPIHPVVADWNADGRLDVVFSNYVDGSVLAYLNQGERRFEVKVLVPSGPGRPRQIVVADVNADTHLDVVVPFEAVPPPHPPVAWVKLNDGQGNVPPDMPSEEIRGPKSGLSDVAWSASDKLLALADFDRIALAKRSETGAWERKQVMLGQWAMALKFTDADQDGATDLLLGYSAGDEAVILWGPLWEQAEAIRDDFVTPQPPEPAPVPKAERSQ